MSKKSLSERAKSKLGYELRIAVKRARQSLTSRSGAPADKSVVWVSGAQRSGTNMMMDVLERSFHTDVYHEIDDRAFVEYELRPRPEIHALVEASKARRVVIKALCEAQELTSLLEEFAPARAVWVTRRWADVVNSHVERWYKMPEFVRRIAEDRDSAEWRGRGMSDETHDTVRRVVHAEISNASACALFWWFRNKLYFEQDFAEDDNTMLVRYESLVTDARDAFDRVFRFLRIPYEPSLVRHVFASSVRKRKPPEVEDSIRDLCDELTDRIERVAAV